MQLASLALANTSLVNHKFLSDWQLIFNSLDFLNPSKTYYQYVFTQMGIFNGYLTLALRRRKTGDIYSPLRKITVIYLTTSAAPYSREGDGVVTGRRASRLSSEEADNRPLGVDLNPLDCNTVEKRMAPEDD